MSSKRRLWPLYAILAITVVPLALAYLAFFTGVGVPQTTVNEGELLKPALNVEELATQSDGIDFAAERKWRLLLPLQLPCEQPCQDLLYVTRQVHLRLNDKSERVERVAVNLAGEEGARYLDSIAAEHPLLERIDVAPEAYAAWAGASNLPAGEHYYLMVDQVGFAMMFYTPAHTGNQLLADIKRVLKYSPEP